eukprot:5523063-Amphidinium_carterae.1
MAVVNARSKNTETQYKKCPKFFTQPSKANSSTSSKTSRCISAPVNVKAMRHRNAIQEECQKSHTISNANKDKAN